MYNINNSAKKGGKGKKKGKKKGNKTIIDALPPINMTTEQMFEHVERVRTELNEERKERDAFQLERDRLVTFQEISQIKFDNLEQDFRNLTTDVQDINEKNENDTKILRQKSKHLMYDGRLEADRRLIDYNKDLGLAMDEFKLMEQNWHRLKRELLAEMKNKQNEHEQTIKTLNRANEDNMSEMRSEYLQRLTEIEDKFKLKLQRQNYEQDHKFRNELHQLEEQKNLEILNLIEAHEKMYADMKDYYNNITLNSVNLINGLKQECDTLRKKDEVIEKRIADTLLENRALNQKLLEQVAVNDLYVNKVKKLNHVKNLMKKKTDDLKIMRKNLNQSEREIEVSTQLLTKLKLEREVLYDRFVEAMQIIQQKSGVRNLILEKRLETADKELEVRSVQLDETAKKFNIDCEALKALRQNIETVLYSKNTTIKDLQYEIARISKAHNDIMKTYESRLKQFEIPSDETGFFPVRVHLIDEANVGRQPAGLVSKCV